MSSRLHSSLRLMHASLAMVASSVILLAGCSMQTTASDGNSFVPAATITGRAMGGQQPLPGSTLNLYAVGTTGYGSTPTLLATTTSGVNGNFSFSQVTTQTGPSNPVSTVYGCPSNGTLLYLTATGGIPVGGTSGNTAIAMLDAIGPCSGTASNFYNINEVTTVVSIAALQQYINPINETIGAPSAPAVATRSSAATGISNAFALVGSLLNYSQGFVNATYTPASSVGTVIATPEVAKINTIADILASCINTNTSSSPTCLSLLAAATAPTFVNRFATNFATSYNPTPLAQDTWQAALFMLQNPTDAGTQVTSCNGSQAISNMACLFSLASSVAPYIGLATAPTDWTVGVTYASSSTVSVSSTTIGVLNYPQYVAIDKLGDVWITNGVTGNGGSLVELSPQGGTIQQVLATPGVLNGPKVPVFDPSGNIYVPNYGSSSTSSSDTLGYGTTVVEFPSGGSGTASTSYTVGGCPVSLASDGAGNIFVIECTAAGGSPTGNTVAGADIREIVAGAAAGSTATVLAGSTAPATNYAASVYSNIAIDSKFNLWVTSGATTVFAFQPPYTAALTTTTVDPEPVSIDNTDDVWVSNYGAAGGVNELSIVNSAIVNAAGSPFNGGGLATAELSAMDGAGNTWITNYVSSKGSVTEFANTGAALTPTAGFAHTYHGAFGIAIDPSGNVWVGNNAADTIAATAASTTGGGAAAGGVITEIIGAAVPVITPIAAGLPTSAGGTSRLGATPQ